MPSDFAFKAANSLHRLVQTVTFGKVGWSGYDMPVIELTTTGRKSGKKHSVMLTSPVQEGDSIVIVASAGGQATSPAWLFNLRDNPNVEVRLQGQQRRPMTAHIADASERARLWPIITKDHKNYADYQTKTDREIPVVVLTPNG